MKEVTLTISSKGQITLPSAIRKSLGLRQGDRLRIVHSKQHTQLVLEKQKSFQDYVGKFADVFPQDAVTAIREIRDRE